MLRAIGALLPDRPSAADFSHLPTPTPQEQRRGPVPFVDHISPIAALRWLDTEFIYFPDIPLALASNDPTIAACSGELSGSCRDGDDEEDDGIVVEEDEEDRFPDGEPLSRRHLRMVAWVTLEDVLGEGVPERYLLTRTSPTSQEAFLSGEMLTRLLVPWGRHLRDDNTSPRIRRWISAVLSNALKEALYILEGLENTYGSMSPTDPDRLLYLAVATTLFGLARWGSVVLGPPDLSRIFDSTETQEVLLRVLAREMDFRWPQSEISIQMERILGANVPFIAYASSLQPTINRIRSVSTDEYVPQHINPSCSCSFIGPSSSTVIELLSQHRIPVVVFRDGQLRVGESTDGPYVAISHVWADGLGSTTEEGLPCCQVMRLSSITRRLVPDGRFWMDALCVPKHASSRKCAIGLMARSYREATTVLVIDGSVRTQCSLSSPKEDCILRIATSGWMERIWTLQEGMLARGLVFEVSDGLIDATHFNGESCAIASRLIPVIAHRQLPDTSERAFSTLCPDPPQLVYAQLAPLLRHRRTSKPADETLAVAGLLRIDAVGLVSEHTRDRRMRRLLLLCKTPLPRYLAVCAGAERMQLPAFHWAPLSITRVFWDRSPDALPATCTEEGLHGKYTVIHFGDMQLSWSVTVTVYLEQDNLRRSQPCPGSQQDLSPMKVAAELIFEESIVNFIDFNAVIMLQDGLAPGDNEIPIAAVILQNLESDGRGVCNCLKQEQLHCQFIMPGRMVVHPLPPSTRGWRARMHNLYPILLT